MKVVEKPWGYEEWWAHTPKYVGKVLFIKDGHRLSLQYHTTKDETVRVMKGTLTLRLNTDVHVLAEGQCMHIAPGTIHRMEANDGDVYVIEVSSPEVDDIVRIQDDYKRV
jgi:mannose-6-phosphate isomerase